VISEGRNLEIQPFAGTADSVNEGHLFDVLSTGDILFKDYKYTTYMSELSTLENGGNKFRYYRANEDKVYSIIIDAGLGPRLSASFDNSKCTVNSLSYIYIQQT
jgi:hypothetical protein